MTEQVIYPHVKPGDTVVIQLKDGAYWPAGTEYDPATARHILTPPESVIVQEVGACCGLPDDERDGTRLCPKCIDSWAIDFYIERPSELLHPSDPTL